VTRHIAHASVGHHDGRGPLAGEDAADEDGLPPIGWKMFDHSQRTAAGRDRPQAAAVVSFFQIFFMASSDTPLLSGTNFHTNTADSTLKPPYSQ
jgi:hypothetical protein